MLRCVFASEWPPGSATCLKDFRHDHVDANARSVKTGAPFIEKAKRGWSRGGRSASGDDQAILHVGPYDPAGRGRPRRNHRAKGVRCSSQSKSQRTLSAGSDLVDTPRREPTRLTIDAL